AREVPRARRTQRAVARRDPHLERGGAESPGRSGLSSEISRGKSQSRVHAARGVRAVHRQGGRGDGGAVRGRGRDSMNRKDLVAAALLLLIAGGYHLATRRIPLSTLDDGVGPRGFPFV